MSNLPSVSPEARHHPLNQDLDAECMDETQACTAIEIGGSRISARGLLAALSRRLRISVTEITFTGNSSQDGGGHADVAVATFIKKHGSQREPKKVAVKKLRLTLSGDMTEEKFLRVFVNELRILDKLSHPNIMEIVGFVEDIENRIAWLVFPWEANGNLREFLRSERWHIPERVSLIRDVAFGLEYLHTHQPPICHGDLKSLNILVNSSNRAVITDFGSARFLQAEGGSGFRADPVAPASKLLASTASDGDALGQNEDPQFNVTVTDTTFTLTGPACSFRWAAPEVLNGEAPDLASDIWALGWIAWEAITDCYPFHELDREWVVTMRIIEGQLPAIYGHDQLSQTRRLCSMMLRCWKSEPKERPSAAECRKILKWIPSGIPVTDILGKSNIQVPSGLLQIGVLFQSYGRNEEASKMFEQGLAIARSNGDKGTIGHILLGLAGIHRARSNYADAEESYTQALEAFTVTEDDIGRARALRGLGRVHQARSQHVEAEESYTQALEIFVTIRDDFGRADVLFRLGNIHQARSNYAEAEESYARALERFAIIGNDLGQANTLLGLGSIQKAQSKYAEAETSYARALERFTSVGDDPGRTDALFKLGNIHQTRSKYAEAGESYAHALEICTSIGDDHGRANALFKLGETHRARSNYPEAENSYTEALEIFTIIRNDVGRANSSLKLGKIRLRQGRFDEAKALINGAAEISGRVDYRWGKRRSKSLLLSVAQAERPPT